MSECVGISEPLKVLVKPRPTSRRMAVACGARGPAGAAGRTEVFVGSQPAIDYAAIAYLPAPGYPGLYLQSVNVP